MRKVFLFAVAFIVCTSFSFAADFESESFDVYSFDPLTNSALEYSVMPLAATSWDTSDSSHLSGIYNAFYNPNSGFVSNSLLGWVRTIASNSVSLSGLISDVGTISDNFTLNVSANEGSLVDTVRDLETLLDTLNRVTVPYGNNLLDLISSDISGIEDYSRITSSNILSILSDLGSLYDLTRRALVYGTNDYPYLAHFMDLYNYHAQYGLVAGLIRPTLPDGSITLYGMVQLLQETLASEDDRLLAESQKQNREEIEDSFLTGSSGSTSLGASDFGDLSDVGGTVKDSISLNGQASVSSFTSGLAGADESGQGWFSAATRDSLDSVSSSVSTFSLDDLYNMSGWYDRYSWVEGD